MPGGPSGARSPAARRVPLAGAAAAPAGGDVGEGVPGSTFTGTGLPVLNPSGSLRHSWRRCGALPCTGGLYACPTVATGWAASPGPPTRLWCRPRGPFNAEADPEFQDHKAQRSCPRSCPRSRIDHRQPPVAPAPARPFTQAEAARAKRDSGVADAHDPRRLNRPPVGAKDAAYPARVTCPGTGLSASLCLVMAIDSDPANSAREVWG
jgi:hypothetical protein